MDEKIPPSGDLPNRRDDFGLVGLVWLTYLVMFAGLYI